MRVKQICCVAVSPNSLPASLIRGIYPNEWYWREGMSLPDVTRHFSNTWKANLEVAKLALSEDIGRAAATLMGWSAIKLGQDTIWWKAPKTKPIAYHQDASFMDFLDSPQTVTCWVTLDDTSQDAAQSSMPLVHINGRLRDCPSISMGKGIIESRWKALRKSQVPITLSQP